MVESGEQRNSEHRRETDKWCEARSGELKSVMLVIGDGGLLRWAILGSNVAGDKHHLHTAKLIKYPIISKR